MKHQEEEKNFDFIYYIVALVCGMFTGGIIDKGFVWIVVGGILGLFFAAFFIKIMVRGREKV